MAKGQVFGQGPENQRNSEYLKGQRPAMMLPRATEFDLRFMGQRL
jgi:hypothetical protein